MLYQIEDKEVTVSSEGVTFIFYIFSGSNGGAISSILNGESDTINDNDSLIFKGCSFVGCEKLSGLEGGI